MGIRASVQTALDKLQFKIDAFPMLQYQPLPWLGYPSAKRGSGTVERWDVMKPRVDPDQVRTAMDIGCNVGFFLHSLADMGITGIGVEGQDQFWRLARHGVRSRSADIALLNMYANPTNVSLLPTVDLIIFLSVFHHWSKFYGMDKAEEMLKTVWARCRVQMFFETGQAEMPSSYNVPDMGSDPKAWLTDFLSRTCEGGKVEHLGSFKAFAPGGDESRHVAYRELFRVSRVI